VKIASQDAPRSRRLGKSEPVILFSVARQLFAIAADAVQEIRSTDSIAGAASELSQPFVPKVRHTFDRGNHQYFVVNAGAHFRLPVTRPTLVLILRQIRVAVLVDRIEQMAEIAAVFELPRVFAGEERRWYRGLVYLNDHVIPVIDPRGFLTQQEFHALDGVVTGQPTEGVASA
jgi:chemotaxis signal transduction protein